MRRFKTCNDFDLYAQNKKKRKRGVEGYKYFIKLIEKYNLILYEAELKLIHGTFVTFHIWQKNREKIVLTWNLWYNYKVIPHNSGLIYVFLSIVINLKSLKMYFVVYFLYISMTVNWTFVKISATTSRQSRSASFSQCGCIESRMDWMGIPKGTLHSI